MLSRPTGTTARLLLLGLFAQACEEPQTSCFAAGTLIATPDGDLPIEAIQIGQRVWSYDHERQQLCIGFVSRVFQHVNALIGSLRMSAGRELRLTQEHPVYASSRDAYVPASELGAADTVLLLSLYEGRSVVSGAVLRSFDGAFEKGTVYNLTVDGLHNYFAGGVLVHNKGYDGPWAAPITVQIAGSGRGVLKITKTFPPGEESRVCRESFCLVSSSPDPVRSFNPECFLLEPIPDPESETQGWEDGTGPRARKVCEESSGLAQPPLTLYFSACKSGQFCARFTKDPVELAAGGMRAEDGEPPLIVAAPELFGSLDKPRLALWTLAEERLTEKTGINTTALYAAAVAPTKEGWAVGERGAIWKWTGSTWVNSDAPAYTDLYAIQADSQAQWIAGAQGTVLRGESGWWSPFRSGPNVTLRGVWGADRSSAWVAGDGGTLGRVSLAGWSPSSIGTTATLYGVWGSGPGDVWAVGAKGTLLHWDGAAWSSVPSGTDQDLLSIHGAGPDDVYFAGRSGTLRHWDGMSVTPLDARTSEPLLSVFAGSDGQVFVLARDRLIFKMK